MNFVLAVAYHFSLALPAAFTQPGTQKKSKPKNIRKLLRKRCCTLASHRLSSVVSLSEILSRKSGGGGQERKCVVAVASRPHLILRVMKREERRIVVDVDVRPLKRRKGTRESSSERTESLCVTLEFGKS